MAPRTRTRALPRTLSALSLAALALAAPLAACGDKDDDDDGGGDDTAGMGLDCMARVSASGAVEVEIDYGADEGCSGSGTTDAASFSWGLSADHTVLLWINSGVDPDAGSQSGLAATVGILDGDTYDEWRSVSDACTVEITSMTPDPDWEDFIWFTGTATCPDPLTDDDGTEVTIGSLRFRGNAPMAR